MLVRGGERRDSAWYAVVDDDWPDVKARLLQRLGYAGNSGGQATGLSSPKRA